MQKGQQFEIRIEDMTEDGAGIGKYEGCPLFVKDAVPGDTVLAEVTKDKGRYAYARLVSVIAPSPDRAEPPCPIARPCGGCQLQALTYEAQLRFKRKKVADALSRIGGQDPALVEPVIGMDDPWRYRNKAEYPVRRGRDGRIVMGFYAGRTHSVIECGDCLIGQAGDAAILGAVRAWMEDFSLEPYDEETGKGLVRHILIRTSAATGDQMVCLVINAKKLPRERELAERLAGPAADTGAASQALLSRSAGPAGQTDVPHRRIASLSYCVNTEKTNVIMGREVHVIRGAGYIEDRIGSLTFRISPQSFYQVNPVQTEKLYRQALELAGLTGTETVWDLYCGTGTISLFLAQRARRVYGVEIIPAAVQNARANAAANGVTNAEFFVGKAEEVLPERYAATGERADVIVVDPPRKGCDASLLRTILEMAPGRVVYVSCDPATLARDVRVLSEGGYRLQTARPVDMFPQTVHVECVSLLQRMGNTREGTITLDVEMEDYYRLKNETEKA